MNASTSSELSFLWYYGIPIAIFITYRVVRFIQDRIRTAREFKAFKQWMDQQNEQYRQRLGESIKAALIKFFDDNPDVLNKIRSQYYEKLKSRPGDSSQAEKQAQKA